MTSEDQNPNRIPFNLVMPRDDAFEVSLQPTADGDGASLFFTGSRPEQSVDLVPGSYFARVKSVANGTTTSFPLELDPNNTRLDLSQHLHNNVPSASKATAGPPLRPRPSDRLRVSEILTANNAIQTTGPNTIGIDVDGGKALVSGDDRTLSIRAGFALNAPTTSDHYRAFGGEDFAVGLSEKAPGVSGWFKPENIVVKAEPEQQGFSLFIDLARPGPIYQFEPPRRLRLTMSIEGRPAIRMPLPVYRGGVRVHFKPFSSISAGDVIIDTTPENVEARGVLTAMSRLPTDEAISVVEWAAGSSVEMSVMALYEKRNDPWLATAAALILCRARKVTPMQCEWIFNLERISPAISDISVAAAWARAMNGDATSTEMESDLLSHLMVARKKGHFTFRLAQQMAVDILGILRSSAKSAEVRTNARSEILKHYARARSQLTTTTYLMWENAGPGLKGGSLPATRYAILAEGRIAEGFYGMKFSDSLEPSNAAAVT